MGSHWTLDEHRAQARFENVSRHALDRLGKALLQGMQMAFRQSQREVPVKTGVLKNSGQLKGPNFLGPTQIQCSITYGGAASAYAEVQHDDRTLNHPRGGKAGYIVDPIKAALPDIQQRMQRGLEGLARE